MIVTRSIERLQTFSGVAIDPFNVRADEIRIEDVAHHLALLCRFAGACSDFYSVGEHSVRVSWELQRRAERVGMDARETHRIALAGLLHDASESVLVDLPRQVKRHPSMNGYRVAERRVQEVIWRRFGIGREFHTHPLIREVDDVLLATERRDLMKPSPFAWAALPPPLEYEIIPWLWDAAERKFLERFDDLGGCR